MKSRHYINWDDPNDIPVAYPPDFVLKSLSEELNRRANALQGATELMESSVLDTPVPVVRLLHRNTQRMKSHVNKVNRYLQARE